MVLVLAAGRGLRMGGPKALMRVGGREWWRVQRDRLRAVGAREVWVVSEEVRRAWAGEAEAPAEVVVVDGCGAMMSSVWAGLVEVSKRQPGGVFVLPVDVPAPGASVWSALRGAGVRPSAPAHAGRRGHPVWLPWGFVERDVLSHADDAGWLEGMRLDRLVEGELVPVSVDDAGVLVNLNDPGDVARWVASGGSGSLGA
ncbi:MAG: NTP transferase domain-containing protein [Phycisphaerae bacterium]|nr:NTP transferase domain-containing protein [Phycisphaerae bacterium]